MRRFLRIIVANMLLALLVCAVSVSVDARVYDGVCTGTDISWSFDLKTRTLTVSGSGDMPDLPNHIAQPWSVYSTLIGKVVVSDGITSVGACSFMYLTNLESVSLPESVTKLSDGAFEHCHDLTAVVLPKKLSHIGKLAFDSCRSLENISIPDSTAFIGSYAFAGCTSLNEISLETTAVTEIAEGLFSGCTALDGALLPENTERISDGAFYGCTKLCELSLPSKLESIGERAFLGCTQLSQCDFKSKPTVGNDAFYSTKMLFTVKFLNADGSVLQSTTHFPGESVSYTGKTPTVANTPENEYRFFGWDKAVVSPVYQDAVYTALFEGENIMYTVTWNVNGTEYTSKYPYGAVPAFNQSTDKSPSSDRVFTFSGWLPEISAVTQNASYTAQYSSKPRQYNIIWMVDGKASETSFDYGALPEFSGSVERATAVPGIYKFIGWTPVVVKVETNALYTARFEISKLINSVVWSYDGKGEVLANVSLSLSEMYNDSAKIRIAVYDKDGRMIGIETQNVTKAESGVRIDIPTQGREPYTVKAFVLDGEKSTVPVSEGMSSKAA